jgi:ABC-type phosphate transport system substrate-binding protein
MLFPVQRVHVAEAQQAAMRLIVNSANPAAQLDRDFVTDAFLKKATRWPDGEAIHPLDQRVDAAVRARFSDGVLHRSIAAVRHYWQQRIFSGRGVPPPELESDAAVIARVQRDRGAIGYVSERANLSADSVKVVSVLAR